MTEFEFQAVCYPPQINNLPNVKRCHLPQKKFIFPICSGAFALSLRESLNIQTPPEKVFVHQKKSLITEPQEVWLGVWEVVASVFFSLPFWETIQTLTGWWFQIFRTFNPPLGGNSLQFDLCIFFSDGWFNATKYSEIQPPLGDVVYLGSFIFHNFQEHLKLMVLGQDLYVAYRPSLKRGSFELSSGNKLVVVGFQKISLGRFVSTWEFCLVEMMEDLRHVVQIWLKPLTWKWLFA